MFGGRFSLTRYSLQGTTDFTVNITVNFTEVFSGLISSGQDVSTEQHFRLAPGGTITLTRGQMFANDYHETLNILAIGTRSMEVAADFEENILKDIYLSSYISILSELNETGGAKMYLGLNTPVAGRFIENINGKLFLGKNISFGLDLREALFARLKSVIVDKDMFVITVTIPSGSELRIDSEYFTVTLDGVNIMHLHNGDWINIDRDTIDMSISSDSPLSGELLYMERYL